MFEDRRHKCRCLLGILRISGSEFCENLALFSMSQPHVHRRKDWKHDQGCKSWPLQKESQHDQDERAVLRVTHMRVWTRCRELMSLLRSEQDAPRSGEKNE